MVTQKIYGLLFKLRLAFDVCLTELQKTVTSARQGWSAGDSQALFPAELVREAPLSLSCSPDSEIPFRPAGVTRVESLALWTGSPPTL